MVDHEVFARRLAKLEQLLIKLRKAAGCELEAFLADDDLQTKVERWLHLAIECCQDLASHLIAERGWGASPTYREAFTTLAKRDVLSTELARQMEGWAGLRNVLVHVYLDVDHVLIHQTLSEELGQLEAYATAITAAAFGEQGKR